MFSLVRKGLIERWRRGGEGHRIPRGTAGSWFQNRRLFAKEKNWGGYPRTTQVQQ